FIFIDAPYQIEFNKSDTLTAVADVDRIIIACAATCRPSCSYKWVKTDGSVVENSKILDLNPVQKLDDVSFVCVAWNKHNKTGLKKYLKLTVNCK
ncbi:hypothetical protein LSH36_1735g00043, partial [Paralvinella palmiformis]